LNNLLNKSCCEVCGGKKFSPLYGKCRGEGILFNYICEECGFIFVLPRPESQAVDSFYRGDEFRKEFPLPNTQQIRENERGHLVRFKLLQQIADELNVDLGGKSLDIGSGLGFFVKLCQDFGFKAVGIDPGAKWLEYGKLRYGVNLKCCSLEEYVERGRFDLISCTQVLEHVLNPAVFLRDIRSLLKDDGMLFIDVPGIDKRYASISDFFWPPHVNTFSKISLRRILAETGFKPLWIDYSPLRFLTVLAAKTERYVIPLDVQSEIIKIKAAVDAGDSLLTYSEQLNGVRALQEKFIREKNSDVVAIEIPFDDYAQRYEYHEPDIFQNIAQALLELQLQGLIPMIFSFDNNSGSQAAIWFSKYNLRLPCVSLKNMPADSILKWYKNVKFSVAVSNIAVKICLFLGISVLRLSDCFEKYDSRVSEVSILDSCLSEKIVEFARIA
jgi:SAM-dependent methyltransferase